MNRLPFPNRQTLTNKRSYFSTACLLGALAAAPAALGQTSYEWDGSQNDNWNDGSNWVGNIGWPDDPTHSLVFDSLNYTNQNRVDLRGGTYDVNNIRMTLADILFEFYSSTSDPGLIRLHGNFLFNDNNASQGGPHTINTNIEIVAGNDSEWRSGDWHSVDFYGILSGSGTLRITNNSAATYYHSDWFTANTFNGNLVIEDDYINIHHKDAFRFATLTLNTDNGFRSTPLSNSDTVRLGGLAGTGDLHFYGNAYHVETDSDSTFSGDLRDGSEFRKLGTGTMTHTGNLEFVNALVNGGGGQFIFDGGTGATDQLLANNGTLTITGGATMDLNGTGLARSGNAGTLLVSGLGTTLQNGAELAATEGTGEGTIDIRNDAIVTGFDFATVGKLGTGTLHVHADATLNANTLGIGGKDNLENGGTGNAAIFNGGQANIAGVTTVWNSSSELNIFANGQLTTAQLDIDGGTFNAAGGTLNIVPDVFTAMHIHNGAQANLSDGTDVNIGGGTASTPRVLVSDDGSVLTLSSATQLDAAYFDVGFGGSGTATANITDGSQVTLTGRFSVGDSGNDSGSDGVINVLSGATVTAGSTFLFDTGTLNIDGGSLVTRTLAQADGDLQTLKISDPGSGSSAVALTVGVNNGSSTYNGVIQDAAGGSGSINKVGNGTLTLSGLNTYTGDTIIDGGSVIVGDEFTLANSTVQLNTANGLDLNGLPTARLGGLSGSGDLNINQTDLHIGGNNANTTFSGSLSALADAQVTKDGSGTWTITGVVSGIESILTMDGTLVVDGGSVTSAGTFPQFIFAAGTMVVRNGGSVQFSSDTRTDIAGSLIIETSGLYDANAMRLVGTSSQVTVQDGGTLLADALSMTLGNIDDVSFAATGNGSSVQAESILFGRPGVTSTSTTNISDGALVTVADQSIFHADTHTLTIDQAGYSTDRLNNNTGVVAPIAISDPVGSAALTVGINDGSSTFDGIISDAAGGPGSINKVGNGTFELTHANNFSGGVTIDDGTLLANNATGSATGTGVVQVNNGGTLGGTGSVGRVEVAAGGTVAPGQSAGLLTIDGNFNPGAGASLEIEIGGLIPGSEHDQLLVTGTANLDGDLDVSLINAFVPTAGDSFDILDFGSLTGSFSAINLPALGGNLLWDTSNLYIDGTLAVINGLPADLDGDGDVDGVDISGFFSNFTGPSGGPPTNPDADLDGDGDVDGVDISQAFAAFTGPLAPANVPEPASLAILALGGMIISRRRSRG